MSEKDKKCKVFQLTDPLKGDPGPNFEKLIDENAEFGDIESVCPRQLSPVPLPIFVFIAGFTPPPVQLT